MELELLAITGAIFIMVLFIPIAVLVGIRVFAPDFYLANRDKILVGGAFAEGFLVIFFMIAIYL